MLLPSSIQRAEDLVGMAMPTVGLVWACAGPASATAPSTMADKTDLRWFMFRSKSVELQSPRYRGLLLAPAHADASPGSIRADGNRIIDYRLQFCKDPQACCAATHHAGPSPKRGSARPRAPTSRMKVLPWCGSAVLACSSIPSHADVTSSRSKFRPTKTGQLGCVAGTVMVRTRSPSGV